MSELGHVVFYVKELERSVEFYTNVVGLDLKGQIFDNRAALLSGGRTHHELLLIQVGDQQGPLQGSRVGLYHVGWKIGDSIDLLKQKKQQLIKFGIEIDGQSDHTISQSLYVRDPDGNEVELYIDDVNYDWRNRSDWMEAPVKPLDI